MYGALGVNNLLTKLQRHAKAQLRHIQDSSGRRENRIISLGKQPGAVSLFYRGILNRKQFHKAQLSTFLQRNKAEGKMNSNVFFVVFLEEAVG